MELLEKYKNISVLLFIVTVLSVVYLYSNAGAKPKHNCMGTVFTVPVENAPYGTPYTEVAKHYSLEPYTVNKNKSTVYVIVPKGEELVLFSKVYFHFNTSKELTSVILRMSDEFVKQAGGVIEAYPLMLSGLIDKYKGRLPLKTSTKEDPHITHTWVPDVDARLQLHWFEPAGILIQHTCTALQD